MIILGSYPVEGVVGRESKDLDLLCTLDELKEYTGQSPVIIDKTHAYVKTRGRIYDAELIWADSLQLELAELILTDNATTWDDAVNAWVPSLNILYMLKMSHRFRKDSPHFLKTMQDIQAMRKVGAFIKPEHMEFYKKREAATYWYQHPNLNRTKAEFFNPEDKYMVYDHDSIHEAVAVGSRPAYTWYAVDGTEVLSSKHKFFNDINHHIRCRGVYEETCVLALERSQIPTGFDVDPEWSFKKALEKVCTSITSGWFREFAWENYDYVLEMYQSMNENDRNYVDEFRRNKHKLRPYEGGM
jgi:hypothetical protein